MFVLTKQLLPFFPSKVPFRPDSIPLYALKSFDNLLFKFDLFHVPLIKSCANSVILDPWQGSKANGVRYARRSSVHDELISCGRNEHDTGQTNDTRPVSISYTITHTYKRS